MTATDRLILDELELDMPGAIAWALASEVRTITNEEGSK